MSDTRVHGAAGPSAARTHWLWDRKLRTYPQGPTRYWQLALAVFVTIILYFDLYTVGGVSPLLAVQVHMSFLFLVTMIAITNLLGAFGALVAGIADRIGRVNLVIWGMLVVGILTAVVVPATASAYPLAVALCIQGFIEGMVLVASMALIRDFSPQTGRAEAMGLWNVGPVAGSLIVAVVAATTLSHFGNAWTSQFRISGIVGIATFVILLFTMKELSPELRDQLMVSKRDIALVNARAARGIEVDTRSPFKQLLRWQIIAPAFGSGFLLLLYFTLVGFGPILYATAFHFNTSEANAIAAWAWGANVVVTLFIGLFFDWTRVRKPWMVVGAILTIIFEIILLSRVGTATSFTALAVIMALLSGSFAFAIVGFYAGYTEAVEARNPALAATGMAIWGWVVRIMAFLSFIVTPLIVTSATTLLEGQVHTAAFKVAVVAIYGEWKVWLWVCVAGTIIYGLTALVLPGPWTTRRANELIAAHDRKVAAEMEAHRGAGNA